MSLKGAGGVVVRRNYSVDLSGGERDEVGVNRGGDGWSKEVAGVKGELMSLTFWMK